MIVKLFYVGIDRYLVEFDVNEETRLYVYNNSTYVNKLITKRIYERIKNSGNICRSYYSISNTWRGRIPKQIIEI